jgi:hypothetical protein
MVMPLNRPISQILSEPNREWTPKPPADEDEIAELRELAPFELPAEYIELLRYCDGGCGELDAPPLLFHMYSIADSVQFNEMWRAEGQYADFWFIGTNGGLETIGFDLRAGPPWPIISIDCIAGEDSVERIAGDVAEFVEKIGLRAGPDLVDRGGVVLTASPTPCTGSGGADPAYRAHRPTCFGATYSTVIEIVLLSDLAGYDDVALSLYVPGLANLTCRIVKSESLPRTLNCPAIGGSVAQ